MRSVSQVREGRLSSVQLNGEGPPLPMGASRSWLLVEQQLGLGGR